MPNNEIHTILRDLATCLRQLARLLIALPKALCRRLRPHLRLSALRAYIAAFLSRPRRAYTVAFFLIVLILAIIRLAHHTGAPSSAPAFEPVATQTITTQPAASPSVSLRAPHVLHPDLTTASSGRKHKIYSVRSYAQAFPDINDLQLAAAQQHGISPVADRTAAEHLKKDLVYIGCNPYYDVARLNNSIPYLVPRAQLLLDKIARNFLDSQYVKHIPPSKLLVTSVTRTQEDIHRLSRHNPNATQNSCHAYGTTFDISYLRYVPEQDPDLPPVRPTRNDTLKYVLSEVLNDLRQQGICYVKYESKQSCFHITVR